MMSTPLRAPEAVGSWTWFFGTGGRAEISDCLTVLDTAAEVLERHGLLIAEAVEVCWEHPRGDNRPDTFRTVEATGPLSSPECTRRLLNSCPHDAPGARMKLLRVHGRGEWVDASGATRSEPDLVVLEAMPLFDDVSVEVAVHHDVWAHHAFSGEPHPEVHSANAPRLAAALKELETTLRAETEPGEPTYFGAVDGYGIRAPEPYEIVDGRAPDLTDKIH
ncbi:hypothetical protein ACOALZ_11785 [Nocardiopsis algeriensis]|uniref:hypothetical protein n=1 Tax=Nocardiopsis algeriensis TaxID=1478215 RepID=UPI003B439834